MRPSVPMSKRFGVCFDESMILQQPGALRPPCLTELLLMTLPFASLLAWLALAAYAGLSWHFLAHAHGWRIPWRRALRTEHLLVAGALALHLLALLPANAHGLALGLGQSLSTVMWLTVLIYWTASFFYKLDGLQTCLMPMAVLGVALAQLLPPAYLAYDFHQPALLLHIAVSLLAYSLLLIAAILAVMMLVLDRALHAKRFSPVIRQMPPLLALERLLFQVLWAGFALLTLTVFSGVLFSEQLFGRPVALSHKTVFALMSWLIFAALMWGRWRHGWRGRLAVRWTLAGFVLLLLAYVGSKFVLEVLLHRMG